MNPAGHTVFLAVDQGFAARYLLRTDIFTVLKQAGVCVVILTPNADEPYMRDEFAGENVFLERYEIEKALAYLRQSCLQHRFRRLRDLTVKASADLGTINSRMARFRVKSVGTFSAFVDRLNELPLPLFRRSALLRRALVALESKLFAPDLHRELFLKYQPSLVVLAGLGNWRGPDAYLMREARRHGAAVVSVVLSWDNSTSRGMGGAHPDHVIAWTETMKQELVSYYDVEPERVFVGGVAHWDRYYRAPAVTRQDLFRRLDLDPARRLILFGTGSPTMFSDLNLDVVRALGEAINRAQLVEPCQLLIRLHPIYMSLHRRAIVAERWHSLEALLGEFPHVRLNRPHVNSDQLPFDLPQSDADELRAMIENCDVLVTPYSTLMIEGCLLQKPVVNTCFEGLNPCTGLQYALAEGFSHIKRILAAGGTRQAYSPEQLVQTVNLYLQRPELEADARRRIAQNECGPNPGEAGRTIGSHLLRLLEQRSGPLSHAGA